ncbi:hypothetical protein BRADI_5g14363v3 [Brachypodium distachyon]|uniref:Uncharacterized protein n=1 Tax=Brachypodium distachyon TaxID=15368 RepID=A0A2K2CH63_BRADI|nr:hypothetical protein BRADI_5g14363v3 [Brachypodium distachyon]
MIQAVGLKRSIHCKQNHLFSPILAFALARQPVGRPPSPARRSRYIFARHGDDVQGVLEQPRRPQDHPLLGPRRQLGLRPRGTRSVD